LEAQPQALAGAVPPVFRLEPPLRRVDGDTQIDRTHQRLCSAHQTLDQ